MSSFSGKNEVLSRKQYFYNGFGAFLIEICLFLIERSTSYTYYNKNAQNRGNVKYVKCVWWPPPKEVLETGEMLNMLNVLNVVGEIQPKAPKHLTYLTFPLF